ncbi:MAG TPA: hypothetical protein VJN90_10295, partial [Candidatus Acidoferrales bacterium]|nr:hypothetical protein [Candidatus Acidoferrales bacterium]
MEDASPATIRISEFFRAAAIRREFQKLSTVPANGLSFLYFSALPADLSVYSPTTSLTAVDKDRKGNYVTLFA